MAYDVVSAASFDARFDEVLLYRRSYYGRRSAQKLVDAFESVTRSLTGVPRMGSLLEALDSQGHHLRWVTVESYIVVYSIREDEETVVLLDLFYGRENWRETLEG